MCLAELGGKAVIQDKCNNSMSACAMCVHACMLMTYCLCDSVGDCLQAAREHGAQVALLFVPKDSIIRRPLLRLVTWHVFDWVMLLVILANCIFLAMDSARPGFESSPLGEANTMSNYVFIAIFMLEAVLKILALGFLFAQGTYLRSGVWLQLGGKRLV